MTIISSWLSWFNLAYAHVSISRFTLYIGIPAHQWWGNLAASGTLPGESAQHDHYNCSPQHLPSSLSYLPHSFVFSFLSYPALSVLIFTCPTVHHSLALCSGFSAGCCDICHLDEAKEPLSNLWPSPAPHAPRLVSLASALPSSLTMSFRDRGINSRLPLIAYVAFANVLGPSELLYLVVSGNLSEHRT